MTLSRVYFSPQIEGFIDLISEMHLIRRSLIRSSLNGTQEHLYTLGIFII
jgi:hypothetical protein